MSRTLLPFLLLLLSSCGALQRTPSEPRKVMTDPVETALDTVHRLDFSGDTVQAPTVPDTLLTRQSGRDVPSPGETADTVHRTLPAGDTVPRSEPAGAIEPGGEAGFQQKPSAQVSRKDTISIIGTGDIMPGTNFPDDRYLPPGGDCMPLFAPVRSLLRSADITFGNLEGVFSGEGGTAKNCRDPEVCYVFRMPGQMLDCIRDAGYDVLSVANNHVNDFGREGRLTTAAMLEEAGVAFAGFLEKPSDTFGLDGLTIGFAAFAPNRGTVNMKDYDAAAAIVARLDSLADLVIVSFHGGAEGSDHQHTPCTDEVYLGYNRGNVCHFAHTVVDAGADVVFGHGPHVTRAMELYKDRLICYSLGNFCTYRRFNLRGANGIAPVVKVLTNREGRFLGGQVIPVYQPGAGGPRIDPQNRAIHKLRELNAADFPGNPLIIHEDGTLEKH